MLTIASHQFDFFLMISMVIASPVKVVQIWNKQVSDTDEMIKKCKPNTNALTREKSTIDI